MDGQATRFSRKKKRHHPIYRKQAPLAAGRRESRSAISQTLNLMTWKGKRQRTAAPGCRFAGNKRCTWVCFSGYVLLY